MQNAAFRSFLLAGASFIIASAAAGIATAQSNSSFLLQLGQHTSQDEARAQWGQLRERHPTQLGALTLHVATVRSADGTEVFRTQAAGISGYEQARNTCSELSAAEVACSVVESSLYQPSTQLAAAPELTIEEHSSAATKAAQESAKEAGFGERYLPWLGFGSDKNATPEEAVKEETLAWQQETVKPVTEAARAEATTATAAVAAAAPARPRPQRLNEPARDLVANTYAAAEAAPMPVLPATAPVTVRQPVATQEVQPQVAAANVEVEVSEAVQVPLTFSQQPTTAQPVNKPVGLGGFPSQPAQPAGNVWLQLSYFTSKDAAFSFSRNLSRILPDVMQFTRVRVVEPFARSRNISNPQQASMRVGPFRSDADAKRLCDTAQQSGLHCSQVREIGGSVAAPADSRRRYDSAQDHHNRRTAVNRGYERTPGMQPAGAHWAQLGAFNDAESAQRYWDQLAASNPETFARLRPQVSRPAFSSSASPVYHLRAGPFVNRVPALDLCGTLQAQALNCIVVQAR